METISTLCAIIVGISMFVTPVLFVIFLIRWAMKKTKKKIGIATLIGIGCFILFSIVGAFTSPGTYCDHQYYVVSEDPATCEEKGTVSYHCDLCGYDRTEKIDALGHDMSEVSRKEPTEDAEGEIVYCCARCEERDVTVIEKLPKPTETQPSADTTKPTATEPVTTDPISPGVDVGFDSHYDGIVEDLTSIGFTEQEAIDLREIFVACGISSLSGMEAVSNGVTIDELAVFRILEDGEPVWFFTIDARSLLYISYYGTDVYDRDNGGILTNVGDIHIPETDMTESEKYGLRDLSETVLDDYFKYTPYYDAWGFAREDDMYMVQCEAYAKNGLGIKDWVPVKVWYQKVNGEYEVVAVQIDGVRYDPIK